LHIYVISALYIRWFRCCSQVCAPATLVLPIVGTYKEIGYNRFQWHSVHIRFRKISTISKAESEDTHRHRGDHTRPTFFHKKWK